MSTRPSGAPQPQLEALATALGEAARQALLSSRELLHTCPDVGDHGTQRVVDAFAEQASDALRALAESVGGCLGDLGDLGDLRGPSPGARGEDRSTEGRTR